MVERRITSVLGFANEPEWAKRLHELSHAGRVEYVVLDGQDVLRRRLRARTDRGTDCLIALPVGQALGEGAVLALDSAGAIVVRLAAQRWLGLMPRDAASALELGYFAGNLHWRVRFDGKCLQVTLEGPEEDYVARVKHFLDDGRAKRTEGG